MEIIQTLSQAEFELIGIPDNEDISKLWETIKMKSNQTNIEFLKSVFINLDFSIKFIKIQLSNLKI